MRRVLRAAVCLVLLCLCLPGESAVLDKTLFDIHPDVAAALAQGQPVVALESTIISHGMPYPQNVQTAQAVEEVVRANGAVPATIAIMGGRVKVGLSKDDLDLLAATGQSARKTSRRDVAVVLASGTVGATTVSATMVIASRVGIDVFVTGGIGGVHMEAESTMDVSADLTELGRTSMAVVCAGVKSILDIPRTLEVLETQGVTVVGYGVDEFPAFFVRQSGVKAHVRMDEARQVADALVMNARLRLDSAILVGVPVPEAHAADEQLVASAIEEALEMAKEQGIGGKEVTPFLLAAVNQLTGGSSLQANIALVKNNAAVGSAIAVEYAERRKSLADCEGHPDLHTIYA